jgi:hypothetical protein
MSIYNRNRGSVHRALNSAAVLLALGSCAGLSHKPDFHPFCARETRSTRAR